MDEKYLLLELLSEQIAQVEEELWEQTPIVQAEIQEARVAYQSGNYMTIDEYIAQSTCTGVDTEEELN